MLLTNDIAEFLLAGAPNWSPATRRQYAWHLERWRLWLATQQIDATGDVTKHLLRSWQAEISELWAPATVKQAVSAARSFLRWAAQEKLAKKKLAKILKLPRIKKRKQRTLRAAEVERLLIEAALVRTRGLTVTNAQAVAVRNTAIVSLLFDSLLRANELCTLRLADLDLAGRKLVTIIKGGDEADACFSSATAERLRAWLAVRQAAAGVATVFVSLGGNTPGQPLTPRGLRIIVKHLGERAGVDGVSPHTFRRGGATQAVLLGASTRALQEMGRWADIQNVERYTQDLDVADVYDRYSPIGHLDGRVSDGQKPEP
jgi:site-specific recombinase XerD